MNDAHLVIDVDFVLGIRFCQNFVDLRRIWLCRIQNERLHIISLRPLHIFQGFHANFTAPRVTFADDYSDLFFF